MPKAPPPLADIRSVPRYDPVRSVIRDPWNAEEGATWLILATAGNFECRLQCSARTDYPAKQESRFPEATGPGSVSERVRPPV